MTKIDHDRIANLVVGIRSGDPALLAKAITLIESTREDHRRDAQELLEALLKGQQRDCLRLGITGVPGVGKSTFIEHFGLHLTNQKLRVAILAIDPSSRRTGGSILADKTRMTKLSRDPLAFIRPSPSGAHLGGVAQRTRESIILCEAAGFDVVIVETVGVGQSETLVANMTDVFLALMLPGAGDEIQGIKRGLMELADILVVNKADGDQRKQAMIAASEYRGALRYMVPSDPRWRPPVLTCSALHDEGLDEVWQTIENHQATINQDGGKSARRAQQNIQWFWEMVEEGLLLAFAEHPAVKAARENIEGELRQGRILPSRAAKRMLDAFFG